MFPSMFLTGDCSGSSSGGGAGQLVELHRSLMGLRREYQELRHATARDLAGVRTGLGDTARDLSTACLQVYTDSQYIRDSEGKQILVGSLKELWEKLERVKLEKKILEERAEDSETEKEQALKDLRLMEKKFETLQLKDASGTTQSEDDFIQERVPSRLGHLEAENEMLISSMFDISTMLDNLPNADSSGQSVVRPRPVWPGRSASLASRRSRSSDSASADTTVAKVQAVLNHNQTELYDLNRKLKTSAERLEQEKQNAEKMELRQKEVMEELATNSLRLVTAEKEAEFARRVGKEIELKMEIVEAELKDMTEQLSVAKNENNEFRNQEKENSRLKDILETSLRRSEELAMKHEKESSSKTKELIEKNLNVSKLKEEGDHLREEISSLRVRLVAVETEQERLEMERNERESTITEEKTTKKNTIMEIKRMKQQEIFLQEKVTQHEEFENKLRGELINSESLVFSLKSEVLECQKTIAEKDSELSKVEQVMKERERSKEDSDSKVKNLMREKDDLFNQLTGLKLRKDSLEDEFCHLREEYQDVKEQFDSVHKRFAFNASIKEQLTEKMSQKEKEMKDNETKIKNLETELETEIVLSDELRLELDAAEGRNKELADEVSTKNDLVEQYYRTILGLKTKVLENEKRFSDHIERVETENECELRKLRKSLKKLEETNDEIRNEMDIEKEEMQNNLLTKHSGEMNKINLDRQRERGRLEDERDYLRQQIENLKNKNNESFVIAENSRQATENLALVEEGESEERIKQLSNEVAKLKREIAAEKKESRLKLNIDAGKYQDCQADLSLLRKKFETTEASFQKERETLQSEIRKLKNEKLTIEQHISDLRMQCRTGQSASEELKERLDNTNEERDQLKEDLRNYQHKISTLENQLTEKNRTIQDKIIEKQKEAEKFEKRIETFEINEKLLLEEIDDCKEVQQKSILEVSNNSDSNMQSKLSNLNLELELLRKQQNESAGVRDEKTIAELRQKFQSSEFERLRAENSLVDLQEQIELENSSKTAQITALQNSLLEGRDREKKLEEIRHRLEGELNVQKQQYEELSLAMHTREGKLTELVETISRLEKQKSEIESKVSSLGSALNQTLNMGRVSTPPRHGRSRMLSGGSTLAADTVEVDVIRSRVRDLLVRLERVDKEKDELTARMELLKTANENLVINTGRLEEDKEKVEESLRNSQVQLKKLETKVSLNDQILAESEESVEKMKTSVRTGERRIRDLTGKLEDREHKISELQEYGKELRDKEAKTKLDLSLLDGSLRDMENDLEKCHKEKILMGDEINKLHISIREKEEQNQVSLVTK